jgi:hypothetical protein
MIVKIDTRIQTCAICNVGITVSSWTTKDPECPEFLRPPEGAWIGFVRGDHQPEMVLICSPACMNRLEAVR